MPTFDLTLSPASHRTLIPFLRKHLRAAHAILCVRALTELSVALVDDATMSDLHQRFMRIAGPTDVLTFPLDEDDAGHVTAGEVVVCIPEARRRSAAEGTELNREVLLYALHGMLHLCGFDDLTAAGFKAMHAKEDAILSQIGIGPVFRKTPNKADKPNRNKQLRKNDKSGVPAKAGSVVQSPGGKHPRTPMKSTKRSTQSAARKGRHGRELSGAD